MATGALVPDAVILKLISNELTTRSWLKARSVLLVTIKESLNY